MDKLDKLGRCLTKENSPAPSLYFPRIPRILPHCHPHSRGRKKSVPSGNRVCYDSGMKQEKWIQSAVKKPGALRAELGVPAGKPIPAKTLAKAAKAPGKLGQRARLAETLGKMR